MDAVTQTLATGILLAGLYSIFALGLSLQWGLLHTINFAHFSFVFLTAYVTYEMASTFGWDPLLAILVTGPIGALLGIALQLFITRFKIDVFGSLIVTFALFLIFEALMTLQWTSNLVRIPLELNPYFISSIRIGPITLPTTGMIAVAASLLACGSVWWLLNRTHAGKGMRAFVQDPEMASAFGVNYPRLALLIAAIAGAAAGITGTLVGMLFVITPTGAEVWIAVIFAVVLLGGLANPLGVIGAALIIGMVESFTRMFADPAMARLMALVVLAVALIFRPEGLFKPIVEEARE